MLVDIHAQTSTCTGTHAPDSESAHSKCERDPRGSAPCARNPPLPMHVYVPTARRVTPSSTEAFNAETHAGCWDLKAVSLQDPRNYSLFSRSSTGDFFFSHVEILGTVRSWITKILDCILKVQMPSSSTTQYYYMITTQMIYFSAFFDYFIFFTNSVHLLGQLCSNLFHFFGQFPQPPQSFAK